jgi:hypothetical protein
MSAMTVTSIAPHVEAAKRLLREIEQHAAAALGTLGQGDGTEFLAAVEEREALLAELAHAVDMIVQGRAQVNAWSAQEHAEASALFDETARATNGVLASQERLIARAKTERDRLAAALRRSEQPDQIANQYSATTHGPRVQTLSVTG